MRILIATSLLVSALNAAGTISVNDAKSHGVVGDAFLSLDEAIRLANGTLPIGALSPAERGQIGGTGAFDSIEIDANVVPKIVLERELTPITGGISKLKIAGRADAQGRNPVIDAGSFAAALTVRTPLVEIEQLVLENGKTGVDAMTGSGSVTNYARLAFLTVRNQTEACFKFHVGSNPRGQTTAVQVFVADLHGSPVGFKIDDRSDGGGLICTSQRVIVSTSVGVDLFNDGANGFSATEFWRSMFFGGTFIKVRRGATSTQDQILRIVHGEYEALGAQDLIDVEGNASSETLFHCHHSSFDGGNNKALHVYPRTAEFDLIVTEMDFRGDVMINTNSATRRIWLANNYFRDGSFVIDNSGAQPLFLWDKFTNYSIQAATGNATPLFIQFCELFATPVQGNSVSGPITLDSCYRVGGGLAGTVTENNPAPAAWIAETSVDTRWVGLTKDLVLSATMPSGMAGVWHIGLDLENPRTTDFPFRFYIDVNFMLPLRGVFTGSTSVRLRVPNNPGLIGYGFYAQMLTIPVVGQTFVPALGLPRGGLFYVLP